MHGDTAFFNYQRQQQRQQHGQQHRPGGAAAAMTNQKVQQSSGARDSLMAPLRGSAVVVDDLRQSMSGIQMAPKGEADTEFLRRALSRIPMLEGVSLQQVERVIQAMELVRAQPRQALIRLGEPNDFMYVIQMGRINLVGPSTNQVLLQGDSFAHEALDAGGPAEYHALSPGSSSLWRLHRRTFKLLQMDYGARLRNLIQSVLDQNRANRKNQFSAMQQIVIAAMERKKEAELINKSLVWQEFADVAAAIEQFSFLGSVGKGAFGEVQLAIHAPTRKLYALKAQKATGDPRLRLNIDREIQCMRDAASPFLMRFFGEVEEGEISKMVLEFLGGGSLEQVMGGRANMKPLPPEHARFYFACVASAFDALHTSGWMHRDLSAKNVMVDNHGYGKLIDVGLAKQVKDDEHTYTTCGTPIYYAPEMIKSIGYGHKAEVWALGVLLYELISGAVPFYPPPSSRKTGNARRMELYEVIVREEPRFNQEQFRTGVLGDPCADLIRQCVRKKAVERIGIANMRTSNFFKDFNWNAFHHKQMKPPFVPKLDPKLPQPR